MLPLEELLTKYSEEVVGNIFHYNYIYLNNFNSFLHEIIVNNEDVSTLKNQKCLDLFKNIHFQLKDIILCKKQNAHVYPGLLPQMLYQTFYLSQQHVVKNPCSDIKESSWVLPLKTDETDSNDIHTVHFVSLGEKLQLPSEKYDNYCLQIHIGAVKCLQFEKRLTFITDSIENICEMCFRHNEVNLEALRYVTDCVSVMTKEQWSQLSKFVYKVIMGQMNHHLPSVHDQCILLFKKCLDLEDLDYILNIVMTEISWSLRIKFFMLTVIASKFGVKKIIEKYDVISVSMWKSLNEPYLLSPCIGLYKTFIKDLSEDDFLTLVMEPIIHYLTTSNNISELTRYNFVTYLLPEMRSKHTWSLLILHDKMNDQSKSDLYLQISVLRMIYNHHADVENCQEILNLSLESGDTKIRAEAFTILCCSKITQDVLDSIYDFIVDNINSDSLTLRLKLISGLETMLRKCKKLNCLMFQFFDRLHVFILKNLTPGSNYQRKITSIKIYSVILRCYRNPDYVSSSCRNLLLTNLLDSEDVRQKCSEILVSYFIVTRQDETYLNKWMKLGLNLCCDPLFYKNESGSTIIYTVTAMVYKFGLTIEMFDISDSSVSAFILNLARKQHHLLKDNFVKNVTNGTLYGLLGTLNSLSFEKHSPEKNKLNEIEIETMLTLIKENLNLMLDTLASTMGSEEKTEAPSFAQMDIALSSLRNSNEDDVPMLPTNQFLLNFIWINIKICCDVASKYAVTLANGNTPENTSDTVYRNTRIKTCADMIADVMIRCRHKGAMDATCRSLGVIIKHWKASDSWCHNMLTDYISCMKPENEISRRSAGIRYLIHAIVTNNKNSVKDCVTQLFNIAKRNVCDGIDTMVDLPQARAHHILTVIVSNASISTECLYPFMEDLIMLCIDNLNSPLWTIRNAALQFFSSLQVRLIGQNRLNNHRWLSHLPLEPLLYHFPRLMQRLQLLWAQTDNKLPSQARLIPFMSLLKAVKLQSWTLLPPENQQFLKSLRRHLWSTGLALEIYTVRNMAAQAYVNTVQVNKITSTLNKISSEIIKYNGGISFSEFKGSNHLHGLMSSYKYLKDIYLMEFNQEYQVFDLAHEDLPPLCKSMYVSMNRQVLGPFPSKSTIDHVQVKHLMIENAIAQSSDLSGLIEFYMNGDEHTAISFLKCFKNCDTNNGNRVFIDQFVRYLNVNDRDIFKEVMINIDVLLDAQFGKYIKLDVTTDFFSATLKKCTSYPDKDFIAMLPVLSWFCPNEARSTLLPFVCKYIDCNLYDSYDRCRSSKSLYYFTDLKDDTRVWNTVVELLQDEDTDVRVEVTRFVNRICSNRSATLNPYTCLKKMFEINTVCSIMSTQFAFTCYWNLLSDIKLRIECEEEINPFFNEQSNVYQEQSNIMKLTFEGLKSLIRSSSNLDYYREVVRAHFSSLRKQCEFKGKLIDESLTVFDTYSNLYFLMLYYKREILILLNFKDDLNIFPPTLGLTHEST